MDHINHTEYIKDALRYSSNRRKIFVEAFDNIRRKLGFKDCKKDSAISIIEYLHSSASIIDDIQDNEVRRKGIPCYYKRNDHATATFASLRLWHEALRLLSTDYDLTDFWEHFEGLLTAQEADTGLLSIPGDMNPLDWYFDVSSRKISEELLIMFKLCNPDFRAIKDYETVLHIINNIGKLIQFIDDRKDVIYENILDNQTGFYIFTYSFPFALLVEKENDYKKYLGIKHDLVTAEKINEKLRSSEIDKRIGEYIDIKHRETISLIENLDTIIQEDFLRMVTILNSEYWKEDKSKYTYAKSI